MPPGGIGSPGMAISSPVARMATRGWRCTVEPGMIGRGGQSDIARGDAPAGRDHHIARGEILAGAADMAAGDHRLVDPDGVAVPGRILLQQDRVGASRDHAAGEQPHRLSGADAAIERMPGGRGADHLQPGSKRPVSGAQRVAVHGRNIGRRLRQTRDHGRRGDAVPGVGEGNDLAEVGRIASRMRPRASSTLIIPALRSAAIGICQCGQSDTRPQVIPAWKKTDPRIPRHLAGLG